MDILYCNKLSLALANVANFVILFEPVEDENRRKRIIHKRILYTLN